MFLLRRPTDVEIRDYLAQQADQPLSYDFAGETRGEPTSRRGWRVDRHRVLLGRGESVYCRACRAIECWQMFPPAVATVCWPESPIVGTAVAVLYWAAPMRLWLLFPARVIYVVDEVVQRGGGHVQRFGFAYSTLPDHPERGEERFLVEWNHADDSVWYDLLAISQPAHWLARLGYFYTRYEQARFRRLSGAAMQRAVNELDG
jgi:uncharacterized protein (UPF0548 family)